MMHDMRCCTCEGLPVGVGHDEDGAAEREEALDGGHNGAGLARARHAQDQAVVLCRRHAAHSASHGECEGSREHAPQHLLLSRRLSRPLLRGALTNLITKLVRSFISQSLLCSVEPLQDRRSVREHGATTMS